MLPSDSLDPVDRRPTPEVIAEAIRDRIMDGSFSPGLQLTEAQLADQLQVSRGPVREAFQRLVQEGLLDAEAHRGVFVTTIEPTDVADVYLARTVIEREAARLVALRQDRRVLRRLEKLVEAMGASATDGSWADIAEADLRFHETLVAGADSPRLARMYDTLLVETRLCLRSLPVTDPDPQAVVAEHQALLDALVAGDERRAVAGVDAHLGRAAAATVDLEVPDP